MLKVSGGMNDVFGACKDDTLAPKDSHLIAFTAQLARCDTAGAGERVSLARAAGASDDEIQCAACHAACTIGPSAERTYSAVVGVAWKANALDRAKPALSGRIDHLTALAACLVSGCDCAAGHIIAARKDGASEEQIARAACITACVGGSINQWRFAAALECARGQQACAC